MTISSSNIVRACASNTRIRIMRKRLALNMPKPRTGSLWQDASSGVMWELTGSNRNGYTRRRVGGKTQHTIAHADLWMFYKPVSR